MRITFQCLRSSRRSVTLKAHAARPVLRPHWLPWSTDVFLPRLIWTSQTLNATSIMCLMPGGGGDRARYLQLCRVWIEELGAGAKETAVTPFQKLSAARIANKGWILILLLTSV